MFKQANKIHLNTSFAALIVSLTIGSTWVHAIDITQQQTSTLCNDLVTYKLSTEAQRLLNLVLLKLKYSNSISDAHKFLDPILKSDEAVNPFTDDKLVLDAQLAEISDTLISKISQKDWFEIKKILAIEIQNTVDTINRTSKINNATSVALNLSTLVASKIENLKLQSIQPQLISTPEGELFVLIFGARKSKFSGSSVRTNQIFKINQQTLELEFVSELHYTENAPYSPDNELVFYPFLSDFKAFDDKHVLGIAQGEGYHLVKLNLQTGSIKTLFTFSKNVITENYFPHFLSISANEVYLHIPIFDRNPLHPGKQTYLRIDPIKEITEILWSDVDENAINTTPTLDKQGNIHWIQYGSEMTVTRATFLRDSNQFQHVKSKPNEKMAGNYTFPNPFFTNDGYGILAELNGSDSVLTFYTIDAQSTEKEKINSLIVDDIGTIKEKKLAFFETSDGVIYASLICQDNIGLKNLAVILKFNKQKQSFERIGHFESKYSINDVVFIESKDKRTFFTSLSSRGEISLYEILHEDNLIIPLGKRSFSKNNKFRWNYTFLENGFLLIQSIDTENNLVTLKIDTGNGD